MSAAATNMRCLEPTTERVEPITFVGLRSIEIPHSIRFSLL